jgi:hypothetical protein
MSVITQAAKDALFKNLDLIKAKVEAYGLDPKWDSGAVDPKNGNPALSYDVEKDAIDAAVSAIDSTMATYTT